MKWPETLTLIRHDSSAYNVLKPLKEKSPLYQEFLQLYNKDPNSDLCKRLALDVKEEISLRRADHNTPLAQGAGHQSETMAINLKNRIDLPDVIFVSPYDRTISTLDMMIKGWPELANVKIIKEERIVEQDHGLVTIFSDNKVFYTLYPDQRELMSLQGEYRYRFPQGENVPDVRERVRSWINTVSRDYATKNVLAVTHHLTILSLRANLERLNEEDFLNIDNHEKPINAGVTIYKGYSNEGQDGHLKLDVYNSKLY